MNPPLDPPVCRTLSAFLASTTDYVMVLATPDGVITAWLGAAERVLGYSPDEAIGQSLSMLFTLEDRARGLDAHEISVARQQGRSEDDRWHLRKNGSRFWASGVLTVLKDDAGAVTGLCKLLRDKTDVRMRLQLLEERIQSRQAEIEKQNAFLLAMAHELRNPLMPMSSALALLARPEGAPMATRAMQILNHQLAVLKALIDDLAQTEGARVVTHLALQRVNLNEALVTASDGFQARAAADGKTLVLLLPATDIVVLADPARLQQMLLNLIGNAFKYTRAGGRIAVTATIEALMAIVRIEDDGVGIAPGMLPHIFELFAREKRHDDIEGLGVGLAVVKELAELHGGNVEARSPGLDQGSLFGLRLPLASN